MDLVRRLIVCVSFYGISFSALAVAVEVPLSPHYTATRSSVVAQGWSPQEAVSKWVVAYNGRLYAGCNGSKFVATATAVSSTSFSWHIADACTFDDGQSPIALDYKCKEGSFNPSYTACIVQNDCPSSGTIEGDSSNAYEASSINPTICIGEGSQGCVWKPGGTVPAVCANGKCYQWGPFTATGASCDPSSNVPGAPESGASAPQPAADCASKGRCPGTVNGTAVCVACGSSSTSSTSNTSTTGAGAGAASGPAGSGQNDNGGSATSGMPIKCVGPDCEIKTTKTTETVCEGAECTTTTKTTVTATSPSGGVSGGSSGSTTDDSLSKTESETEDKQTFCTDNPKSVLCKDALDSKWGGACDGGFTCDGDAVQCAQSQASWKSYCEHKVDPTQSTVQLGQGSMTGEAHPGNHPYLDPTAIDFASGVSGVVNAINPFGGACPSDITIPVMGTSVVVPLSDACPILRIMGLVAVAFTTFACAFIQLGALKSL